LVGWLRGIGEAEWAAAAGVSGNAGGGGSALGEHGEGGGKKKKRQRVDLLRMMHEIAKGMEYLHSMGVLHGDLKASNVLVDDKIRQGKVRCVISDFGQSEIKSEVYRLSGAQPPRTSCFCILPSFFSIAD
jgi:serine/threonine protein kinase